jgi:formylglycine-generating enzyme
MKKIALVFLLAVFSMAVSSAQQQPVVSNIQVGQRSGTKLVDISYNLAYAHGPVTIWVDVSSDGGRSYVVPAKTFSGHIGQGVSPGTNRQITWNAEADFDGLLVEQMRVRINARGGVVPIPPPGMVLIPGGHFQMGEWAGGSGGGTLAVYTNAFFMDRYEVSGALYAEVKGWADTHGYSMSGGSARAGDHPIQYIYWFDAVKWCNARSEKEGLTPVYYTDTARTTVYRSGNTNITNAMVRWDANGYRLPTEAEWEKAARGGLSGNTYPWGDSLDFGKANYSGSNHPWSGSTPRTTPVGYYNGDQTPSGGDMVNNYGIYDMAGNVFEWCWDWYGAYAGGSNPKGPDSGSNRVLRGGSWNGSTSDLGCAARNVDSPSNRYTYNGFRCVRGL